MTCCSALTQSWESDPILRKGRCVFQIPLHMSLHFCCTVHSQSQFKSKIRVFNHLQYTMFTFSILYFIQVSFFTESDSFSKSYHLASSVVQRPKQRPFFGCHIHQTCTQWKTCSGFCVKQTPSSSKSQIGTHKLIVASSNSILGQIILVYHLSPTATGTFPMD